MPEYIAEKTMPEYIIRFAAPYRFLSNFWKCEILFEGHTYKSTEHAYQAAKTVNQGEREIIRNALSSGEAKRLGGQVSLRENWNEIRDSIMLELLRVKFTNHKELEEQLLATGDKVLVEGNDWHDKWFGVCYCDRCKGRGKNRLGELLMQVRKERKAAKIKSAVIACYEIEESETI